jgi:hypothetical protein
LGEPADDDGFEVPKGFGVEGFEERVLGAINDAKVGQPSTPDTSLLRVGRGHGSSEAGSSRKSEQTHELITSGRGRIWKPTGSWWGKWERRRAV